jgi:hypothetical protein
MTFGDVASTERPPDRTDVARFYAVTGPNLVFNQAARQIAEAEGHFAVGKCPGSVVDQHGDQRQPGGVVLQQISLQLLAPETAIRAGDTDGNRKTDPDTSYAPLIVTPCFPSYPSNHGSGSNGAAEVLRRLYGEAGHSTTISNPAVPDVVYNYTRFKEITDDISDAGVYGGIHFRFDQVAGERLGRAVGSAVYKNNLRPVHGNK